MLSASARIASYVDQVASYLTAGIGRLGFIVGRAAPGKPASRRALDVFQETRKVILFLCHDDLGRMLDLKEQGDDPTELIKQLYDAFITLT